MFKIIKQKIQRKKYIIISIILIVSMYFMNKDTNFCYYQNVIRSSFINILDKASNLITINKEIFKSKKSLIAEKEQLENEIFKQKHLIANANVTMIENNRLKEVLNFFTKINHLEYKSTYFTLAINTAYNKIAFIKAGLREGVENNSIVMYNDVLIGQVDEVYENYSKVLLLGSNNLKIPVISEKSLEKGILIGNNDNLLQLVYNNSISQFSIGEHLIVSADSNIYPTGLLVAKIVRIVNNNIYAETLIDLAKVKIVNIIK